MTRRLDMCGDVQEPVMKVLAEWEWILRSIQLVLCGKVVADMQQVTTYTGNAHGECLKTPGYAYEDKGIRRIGVNFLGVRDKIKSIKIITINHIKCVSLIDEQLCIRRIGCSGYAGSGIDHYAFFLVLEPGSETPNLVFSAGYGV
ncbi:hypothetical protein Tco_1102142 [Tanacetum coccineum]